MGSIIKPKKPKRDPELERQRREAAARARREREELERKRREEELARRRGLRGRRGLFSIAGELGFQRGKDTLGG